MRGLRVSYKCLALKTIWNGLFYNAFRTSALDKFFKKCTVFRLLLKEYSAKSLHLPFSVVTLIKLLLHKLNKRQHRITFAAQYSSNYPRSPHTQQSAGFLYTENLSVQIMKLVRQRNFTGLCPMVLMIYVVLQHNHLYI